MSQNRFWALGLAAKLAAVLLVLLLVAFPTVMHLCSRFGMYPDFLLQYLDKIQYMQSWAMRIVLLGFVFYFGSCFASFLNVVAWRVPRGRGVNGSSHCPHCDVKLNFTDNLPVIGWIRIGGECRNCKAEVSPRYLVVEIILGLIFVIVFSAEMLTGGSNLPLRSANTYGGFHGLVMEPKWDLIQLGAFQAILICYLFALAVIRTERLKIPQSVFWFAVGAGFVFPLAWPDMLLVPWQIGAGSSDGLTRFSTTHFLTLIVGGTVGLLCGSLIDWFRSGRSNLNVMIETGTKVWTMSESIACLTVVGLFLGWQSVLVIGILSLALNHILEFSGLEFKQDDYPSEELDSSTEAISVETNDVVVTGVTSTPIELNLGAETNSQAIESEEPDLETIAEGIQDESLIQSSEQDPLVSPIAREESEEPQLDSPEKRKSLGESILGIYPATNFAGMVLIGTVVHIITWRWSNCLPGWPFGWNPAIAVYVSIVLVLMFAAALRIKKAPKLTS